MDARTLEIRQMKEQLEGHLKHRIKHANLELSARLRSLGERLLKAADALENAPDDPSAVNSCGEVQGMGPEIDRWCGVRAALLEDSRAVLSYLELIS